ncbi:hypothetical protein XM38_045970 [Halomicronema hongdechloris C2206]|uniref:RDD domain-containing protein n=1 Tax=Halomicronema hongdechloris C2206 TaxID=1641165 RepID=A0A1Z3HTN7_9CYAN|nr:RDD family protein [Halomicronema hongdechloris]ASC73626.1 hypothetical protein XM38_045970 [Halomicronema hongdechloris C2206]
MKLLKSVTITTPESVELEFVLAGIGNRAIALLVDYLLLAIFLLLLQLIYLVLIDQLALMGVFLGTETETLELWLIAIFLVVSFALYVGYFVGFETLWYGRSPGKRLVNIRVIRDDAQPARLFQATLRSLLRPVDDVLFLGYFLIMFGAREKRLGDWLAGTLVVQTDLPTTPPGIPFTDKLRSIAAALMQQGDLARLDPDDFALLREFLQRRQGLVTSARNQLSMELARSLRQRICLETLPQEMTAETFLEALYWAYQRQYGRGRNHRSSW